MNNGFNKNEGPELLEGFTSDFPEWAIEEFFVELKLGARISVFCCMVPSLDRLASEWRQVSSFVGAKSITLPPSNFSRWNSYLVYFCETPVPRSLKYEIENDKFASRKMVEGGWSDGDDAIIAFLNEELLLSHINLQPDSSNLSAGTDTFSTFGQMIIANGISAGIEHSVISNRKSWLEDAVVAEVERLTNED
ncbi:ABC-three component system middle component 1 [Coraliomargarita sp. W4R72]